MLLGRQLCYARCTQNEHPHIPEAKSITFYLENVRGGIKELEKKPTETIFKTLSFISTLYLAPELAMARFMFN
jgi:hypothetical protein